MIECKNCGRFISPDNGYCDYCGEKISEEDIKEYQQNKLKEAAAQKEKQKDSQKYNSLLDEKSKGIIDFFKVFNIVFAILNIIAILLIFFTSDNFMNLPTRITIIITGLGYTALLFMLVEMLTKHFSNVAQIKEMNYQAFVKNQTDKL